MANFKHHLMFGMCVSTITSSVGYFEFELDIFQAGASFILGSLASLAPDLDHPESIPGQLLFELLGVLLPLAVLSYISHKYQHFKLEQWIVYYCLGYIVVRYGFFYIFDKLTTHRGIFHSLPAAVICGQIVFLLFANMEISKRLVITCIGALGYLTHLIVDECYSVDWEGNKIKHSLGTAVDIGRFSELSTWLAYFIMIGLGWLIWNQMITSA